MKMRKYSVSNLSLFIMILFDYFSMISTHPIAPALYVFGDSLFDCGNNNLLPTIARANYPPYGVDFANGVTGRFTNGRTVADFIAEFLGLPYPPAYMSNMESETYTGFNYASGSCGILPQTGRPYGKCLSLEEQINFFQKTIESNLAKQFRNPNELTNHLSNSIYIFSVGSNDYLNYYLHTNTHHDPQPFAQHLVDVLSQHFQRLYTLGARKIVMFEIGPIGCIPLIKRRHNQNEFEGGCIEELNQLISDFNNKIPIMLANLTSILHGSRFSFGHANWLAYDAIKNPLKYGLMDASNPCCTTWGNGTSGCIPLLVPCPNPNQRYFWDAYHLTEAVYSVIATRCLNDSSVCSPSLKEFVKM